MQCNLSTAMNRAQTSSSVRFFSLLSLLSLLSLSTSSSVKREDIWYNNIHLMYGPVGNSYFCFSESPDVSHDEVEGNIRTRGKIKLTSFPRDHALSVLLYI